MSGERRIVGLHAAQSAIQNTPERLLHAWLDGDRADDRLAGIRKELIRLNVPMQFAGRRQLDQLSEGRQHQGVVLAVNLAQELGESALRDLLDLEPKNPLFLVLDQIQDPHNLGACLRTADAAGVLGVIVPKDQSASLTPAVSKVASGAAETVPIYKVTNLARALGWLKDAGIWIGGAAGEAEKSVYETDLVLPFALVVGAEGRGMRRLTRERCDFLIKIPMVGSVESLNVSVATGILLFEALRQRQLAQHD